MNVSVSRVGGETVVEAECRAPWLLADLGAGSYAAKVNARGEYEKTVNFEVKGDGQSQVVVPFPEITGT